MKRVTPGTLFIWFDTYLEFMLCNTGDEIHMYDYVLASGKMGITVDNLDMDDNYVGCYTHVCK